MSSIVSQRINPQLTSRHLPVSFDLSQFVGSLRVLFMLESDLISVYRVKDRKEVYE